MTSQDPNRVIASLARDQINLDLKTVDLCFLAGLYLRADRASLASFEEDQLVDMFEQVCDVVEPGAENPRKRATHAIQRLRDQRMLARVDGNGIVRAGEYALTRLAAAVIEYFLADEALTRESLTLLTGTLRAQLAEVLAAAKKAEGEAWRQRVIGPLRVTVGDLVAGIERRQRGLDAQQEEVQAQIAGLLSADWFSAVDRCQALLDTTTGTLRDLNEILLRDTNHLVALLQEIQTLASASGSTEAEEAAQRVIEHVDRISAWGSARQRGWSEYYQYVHRYLRDVVRLDPDRALSQRLRDQLGSWVAHPFSLVAAHATPMRLLRSLEARVERPIVVSHRDQCALAERAPTLSQDLSDARKLADRQARISEQAAKLGIALGSGPAGVVVAALLVEAESERDAHDEDQRVALAQLANCDRVLKELEAQQRKLVDREPAWRDLDTRAMRLAEHLGTSLADRADLDRGGTRLVARSRGARHRALARTTRRAGACRAVHGERRGPAGGQNCKRPRALGRSSRVKGRHRVHHHVTLLQGGARVRRPLLRQPGAARRAGVGGLDD